MKRLVSLLLVVAFLLLPVNRSRSDDTQPKSALIICGLVVLGVGAVVIWEIYKLCKRLPPVDGTENPPATNAPPTYTQAQIAALAGPPPAVKTLTDDGARLLDISSLGYADGNTGTYFIGRLDCQIQVSDNAVSWVCAYRVAAWFGPAGTLYLFSDAAGNPVSTNYCRGGMGQVPINLGTGKEPARFFRVTAP